MNRRLLLAAAASVVAVAAATLLPAADPAPTYDRLVWSEEFDGPAGAPPDPATWNFQKGGYGWGNHELQCYTDSPDNVATDGRGRLVITVLAEPGHQCSDGHVNDFTSARITTQGKYVAKYGRLEIRALVPSGSGTWGGFWALGQNMPEVDWPRAGEFDVMELTGREPRTLHATLHAAKKNGEHMLLGRTAQADEPLNAAFHVHSVDWSPDRFVFALDGRPYATITRDEFELYGVWAFDQPFYLLLNMAVGGTMGGRPDTTSTWPQRFLVDYIRVYR